MTTCYVFALRAFLGIHVYSKGTAQFSTSSTHPSSPPSSLSIAISVPHRSWNRRGSLPCKSWSVRRPPYRQCNMTWTLSEWNWRRSTKWGKTIWNRCSQVVFLGVFLSVTPLQLIHVKAKTKQEHNQTENRANDIQKSGISRTQQCITNASPFCIL